MPVSRFQADCADILARQIGRANFDENIRPSWLEWEGARPLELDFFIPDLAIAFEIQGKQHYQKSDLFHRNQSDFEAQQLRDEYKRHQCEKLGIRLFEIYTLEEMRSVVSRINMPQSNDEHPYKFKISSLMKQMTMYLLMLKDEVKYAEDHLEELIKSGAVNHPVNKARHDLKIAKKKLAAREVKYSKRMNQAINSLTPVVGRQFRKPKPFDFYAEVPDGEGTN